MFYKDTATLYTRSRDLKNVSRYTSVTSFKCKIEPIWEWVSFDWANMFNAMTLYTEYQPLKNGDKLVVDSVSYIIKNVKRHRGILRQHNTCLIQKSEWG